MNNVPGDTLLLGDTPLWRYMKVSTLFMLLEGKAFFPSVATLRSGDSLEGDLIPDPELLMGMLNDVCKEKAQKLEQWLELRTQCWQKEILNAGGPTCGIERAKFLAEAYILELAKRRAVWCWFSACHESAGMWSVYGKGGIAVRTHPQALEHSLPQTLEFQIARITYANRAANSPSNYFDTDAPKNRKLIHRPHLVKGEEYKHENEIRITTACCPEERGRLVTGIDAGSLIKEVVISPLLPFEEAEAIEKQVKRHDCGKASSFPIRRSSILGRFAGQQESGAALDKLAEEIGVLNCESGLPAPLTEL